MVQVNGKVRGKITVPADVTQERIETDALADPKVARFSRREKGPAGGLCAAPLVEYRRGGINVEQHIKIVLRRFGCVLAAMACCIAGGCGYQFAGESSLLPKDVRTIYVEPFFNRSRDVGLEKELTIGAAQRILSARTQLQVVDQAEQADVIRHRGDSVLGQYRRVGEPKRRSASV